MGSDFTAHDRTIARCQKNSLDSLYAEIIHLRYWHCQTIEEIAHRVRRDWEATSALLKIAEASVKDGCLADPTFSRSTTKAAAA